MLDKRRGRAIAGALVLTAGLMFPGTSPASAYSPGTATAHRPQYNVDGTEHYSCSFAGWRSTAKVSWTCSIIDETSGNVLAKHSGTWTPPPGTKTTATFKWPVNLGEGPFCTVAHGLSVDGGAADTSC